LERPKKQLITEDTKALIDWVGIVLIWVSARSIPTFWADHPFVFLIWDEPSESILFMGRAANPAQ
jgi:serine protease inhibitor